MGKHVQITSASRTAFLPNATLTVCVICGQVIGDHGVIITICPERGITRHRSICQTHSHDPCLVTDVIHQAQQPVEETGITRSQGF